MTNVRYLMPLEQKNMRGTEMVDLLVGAGFTKSQAVALTGVITAIRANKLSRDEAEEILGANGFNGKAAHQISDVFFKALAA